MLAQLIDKIVIIMFMKEKNLIISIHSQHLMGINIIRSYMVKINVKMSRKKDDY